MNNRTVFRGLFLAAISLAFGLGALRLPVGSLAHAGAGLFPLLVSGLLMLIAIATLVGARYGAREPMQFQARNIGLILLALGGFAVVSLLVNMTLGIVFMVFVASRAGTSHSLKRNLLISLGLVAIAFGFQKLLGLSLPLY